MTTVRDEVTIHAHPDEVFACIWNARLWPRITSHVKGIEMLEEGERSQRFLMTVEADGREHTVESVRQAEPGRRVCYRQTRPPIFLREHSGEWALQPVAGGVRIQLVHQADIDYEQALPALGVASPEEAEARIARTLKANGSRTLLAIKQYLESAQDSPGAAGTTERR